MTLNTGAAIEGEGFGWAGNFPVLKGATLSEVVNALMAFVRDGTPEQIRAWNSSIPLVQLEAGKVLDVQPSSKEYGAVFEYMMPYSQRRVDVILLVSGAVLVVELKGDSNTRQRGISSRWQIMHEGSTRTMLYVERRAFVCTHFW